MPPTPGYFPRKGVLSPGPSLGGAAWPQLPTAPPPRDGAGMFWTLPASQDHLSGCVLRRQACHPDTGACPQLPVPTIALPSTPAVSEPLRHQDHPARPAPHLHRQAQLQPPENTHGAVSLAGTPGGSGNGARDAVWGEFNKSPLKNVFSFPQEARALLSLPDPPLMPNSLPRWGPEDRPPLSAEVPVF